ncbi:MAG: hypothetical protein ACRDTG_18615 [Pseudonocardiaceae bacterium]
MIREDRELLAELARLNREMAALALRMLDGSASSDEQQNYAQRLITVGQRLWRRAQRTAPVVIEGAEPLAVYGPHVELPAYTVEPGWEPREQG